MNKTKNLKKRRHECTLIDISSETGKEFLKYIYNLNPTDIHYDTLFQLDFHGNVFSYSKKCDDENRMYYLNYIKKINDFADFDYHYYIELKLQFEEFKSNENFEKHVNVVKDEICQSIEETIEYDEDRIGFFDTAPFCFDVLVLKCYLPEDKDYFTLYEHLDNGNWYFYSKYLNDLFRKKEGKSNLNWLVNNPGWYNYYFGKFCSEYISDFKNSSDPEIIDDTYFAPFIDDDFGIFEDEVSEFNYEEKDFNKEFNQLFNCENKN